MSQRLFNGWADAENDAFEQGFWLDLNLAHIDNFANLIQGTSKNQMKLDYGMVPIVICDASVVTTVGQRGFWDERQRVTKLQYKKPVLNHLVD